MHRDTRAGSRDAEKEDGGDEEGERERHLQKREGSWFTISVMLHAARFHGTAALLMHFTPAIIN